MGLSEGAVLHGGKIRSTSFAVKDDDCTWDQAPQHGRKLSFLIAEYSIDGSGVPPCFASFKHLNHIVYVGEITSTP
jgi:hypothetical protein